MYYQNYEDYMRNVLGYPVDYPNYTYDTYAISNERNYELQEDESLYPEIYRLIQPLVKRECDAYNGNPTKEDVNNIVDKIYSTIENNVNITIDNLEINRQKISKTQEENRNKKDNKLLRDLIYILVLKQLLNRPRPQPPYPTPRPPIRPPYPNPIMPRQF